jgi:hypothetical protein
MKREELEASQFPWTTHQSEVCKNQISPGISPLSNPSKTMVSPECGKHTHHQNNIFYTTIANEDY